MPGHWRVVRKSRMTGRVVKVLADKRLRVESERDALLFLDGYGRSTGCGPHTSNQVEFHIPGGGS